MMEFITCMSLGLISLGISGILNELVKIRKILENENTDTE